MKNMEKKGEEQVQCGRTEWEMKSVKKNDN